MRLGPIWQKRAAAFWAQRRGRVSLCLFLALFGLSLAANLLANEKPLLLEYRGRIYCPLWRALPEQSFGQNFLPSAADYTNPAVQAAIRAHGWMLWPPLRFGPGSLVWAAPAAPAPPSWRDPLGTDDMGRDVLARLLYGLRLSLLFGLGLTLLAAVIGVAAGALQGYYGGLTDLLGQRLTEIWSGMPQLFLLMLLSSLLAPGFFGLLLFLALFSWMPLSGLVRAEFLRGRAADYVRAARALGLPDVQIMARHILPNAMIAVVSLLPFLLLDSIVLLASLDFLGLGIAPGAPSLGELVAQARDNPADPWAGLIAFLVLGGLLMLLAGIGSALRQALDPRRGAP